MNVYGTEQIRNVVLLGHGGAGKTTVAEAMALITGVTKRMGKVADGNTISDYDKEEIKRQFSISTTLIPLEYQGENGPVKINLLDTPGFFDFVGEVEEAISVADAAIIVVNCKAGIEPGTERAWEMCEKYNLPRLIFVTNMDDDHASYRELVVKLEKKFGRKIAPFQLPIRENEKFVGFVNVVKMAGRRFTNLSDYVECEIPDYVQKNLTIARDALIEAVAETSEEYMERYFLGEEFTQEEISGALRAHVIEGDIVPVMMGSGINCQGFKVLLQVIDKYFPAPNHFECIGVDVSTGERFTAKYNDDVSLSARVFKTIVDPFIGKYSLMKICTGTLKGDTVVYNVNKDAEEKIGKVYIMRGKEVIEVPELKAGDIGALAKLSNTSTQDTLSLKDANIIIPKIALPGSVLCMAIKPKGKGDEDKLSAALTKIREEDPTIKMEVNPETKQTLVYGVGEQQLDVMVQKLKAKYKIEVDLTDPIIPYRETIKAKASVRGRYKKQSGGHGQFGDVVMEFEPSYDTTTPVIFEEKIFGGSVPKQYFPAVEKGLQECVQSGVLAGYPVVGLKATLTDGSYHPVDSSEMAFKMATSVAFKEGIPQAKPVILEPIEHVEVLIPDKYMGDIMGDITKRRGRILSMDAVGMKKCIVAEVPTAEMHKYATDLRSMTQSRGEYRHHFERYEEAPMEVQKKIIEARAAEKEK